VGFSATGFSAAFGAAFATGFAGLAETVFVALTGLPDGFFTGIYELPTPPGGRGIIQAATARSSPEKRVVRPVS
jgi:hypothetical protein